MAQRDGALSQIERLTGELTDARDEADRRGKADERQRMELERLLNAALEDVVAADERAQAEAAEARRQERAAQRTERAERHLDADLRRTAPSPAVSTLPRERVGRLRAGTDRLPSELVVGIVLLLIAMTAAALLVLGVLRAAIFG